MDDNIAADIRDALIRIANALDDLYTRMPQPKPKLEAGSYQNIATCRTCGSEFLCGMGTGRRLNANFCSDEHRQAWFSKKERRDAAKNRQKPPETPKSSKFEL